MTAARFRWWTFLAPASHPLVLYNSSPYLSRSLTLAKGCQYLASALEAWPHSLHTLVIANCGVGGKGMQYILSALCKNFGMSLGIEVLDLSENKMDVASSM